MLGQFINIVSIYFIVRFSVYFKSNSFFPLTLCLNVLFLRFIANYKYDRIDTLLFGALRILHINWHIKP